MKRVYSDAERAAAMAAVHAAGGPPVTRKMARDAGIPYGTLNAWATGKVAVVECSDVRALETKAEEQLADRLERLAMKLAGLVEFTADQLDGVTLPADVAAKFMVSLGIAVDKFRILREQPSAIIAVDDLRRAAEDAGLDPDAVLAEVNAILKEHA